MKLIVREHITAIAEPIKKVYNVTIDAVNNFGKIPASIGEKKGDLIIFRGPGDPIRIPAGTIAGRILVTDPDSECGWSVVPNSSSSGSSVTLHNITGLLVKGGTVVKISSDYDFVKATSADTSMLFVTAEDCAADADVVCYGVANTICSVLCSTDAVAVNDQLHVSSTDGQAETVEDNGFAVALSAKAAGSVGVVDAIIVQNGFLPLGGGTLSGDLILSNVRVKANSVIDEDTAPGSSIWYAPLEWYDADGNLIGHVELGQDTSNKIMMQLGIRRNISGSWTWKQISFTVDTSGGISWNFGDAAAARNALGASSGIWPVSVGGTGANSAANARTNLGITGIAVRPDYSISTTDLTNGSSSLATGKLYFVYG